MTETFPGCRPLTANMALKRGTARRLGLRPPTPRLIIHDVRLGIVELADLRREFEVAVANWDGRCKVIS